jgi:hypothetical protein
MTSEELTKRLIEREYRPWLVKGKWQLSVVLKPYGVVPSDTVLTKTKGKLAYLASQFREVKMNDTGKGG